MTPHPYLHTTTPQPWLSLKCMKFVMLWFITLLVLSIDSPAWTPGLSLCHTNFILPRDHSRYGLSQWETTLHCNVVSHWLSPYPEWSPTSYLGDEVPHATASHWAPCEKWSTYLKVFNIILIYYYPSAIMLINSRNNTEQQKFRLYATNNINSWFPMASWLQNHRWQLKDD